MIQKYQYRNILVFSSKHILLHSSKCWFWRWLYASDPKAVIGLLVISEGKNPTAGLLRFFYSSVLSFESKENMEKEIFLNQLDCSSIRILKTWSKITGEETCSVMGIWNFHYLNICLMMLFFSFKNSYEKFENYSAMQYPRAWVSAVNCWLLENQGVKSHQLALLLWNALQKNAEQRKTNSLPLRVCNLKIYNTVLDMASQFPFLCSSTSMIPSFTVLCSLTLALEHEPYLHCLCGLLEHFLGVKNTAHFISLWAVEVIFTARWQ